MARDCTNEEKKGGLTLGRQDFMVKNVYPKYIFLISQPKHMLWVLKRTVSMRRLFHGW